MRAFITMVVSLSCCLSFVTIGVAQQTTVFYDDFNRVSVSPGGTPSLTYTTTNTGAGAATIESSTATGTVPYMKIANGTPAGRSSVVGPLASFNSPFNTTLSSNTDLVSWSFNARHNRNTTLSGFDAAQYGYAVILMASSSDLSTANGYAVVSGGSASNVYRLVKFTGGIYATANVTTLVTGMTQADRRDYMSIKVTYNPTTATWSYYDRTDGPTATPAWADPSSGTYTLRGTSGDAAYTGTAMSHFGFLWNYSTAASTNSFFDNFKVAIGSDPVNFYYSGTGDITTVTNWGMNTDGTGTNPANFTTANQIYNLRNTSSYSLTSNWTVSGTSSKIVVGNGTNALTLTIGSGGSITGTVDVSANATLEVIADAIPTFGAVAGTVSFNNASGFTLAADAALPAGNGSFVMTAGNIAVGSNTLTVNGSLNCGSNLVTGNGTFTLASGGTLKLASVDGISASGATGNIQTATRNFNTGANYTYNSTSVNAVTGSGLPATVNALTVNLTNAADILSLTNSLVTTGNLTLTNGLFKIGNNNVTVGNPSGGSASSYIVTNGSGTVIRSITTTSTTVKTFHIGSTSEYRKIVFTFPSTTGLGAASNLNVRYVSADPGSISYPGSVINHYTNGYWAATMDTPPVNTYTVDIETAGMGGLSTVANARILKRADASSAWDFAGTFTSAGTVITETGCSGFSQFTVGSTSDPMPVELTSFTGALNGRNVELKWTTATEQNNHGFEIEKNISNTWKKIGFMGGNGTTNTQHSYSFVDAAAAGRHQYRLKQIDNSGTIHYSNSVEVSAAFTAKDYTLAQNYPNPFNPSTDICFVMKNTEHAVVTVYNLLGQHVATLFDGIASADQVYSITFDGKNLPSGLYFYSLRSATRNETRKMMLLK
ncbi:MAG: T9SS type A sorting domain-containing protein [Bacteroidota bacterium]